MTLIGKCLYAKALFETKGKGEEAMAERLIELVAEACAARVYKEAPTEESARKMSRAIEIMFGI